jgi:hypothetical protein
MILFFTGWGVLAVLIPALFAFLGYEIGHGKGAAIGVILSAIPIWLIGRRLNGSPAKQRTLVDEQTGQRFVIASQRHTLFFINLEYWALAAIALGVFLYFRY